MIDYTGFECPACEEKFKAGDDIVVCPECGAPHHRTCFSEKGRCSYSGHESGVWEPAKKSSTESELLGDEAARCPMCNTKNPKEAEFCQVCGGRLKAGEKSGENKIYDGPVIAPNPYTTPYGGIGEDEKIDGIPVKDWVIFTGNSSYYFLPRFLIFSRKLKGIAINWAGFIFGGFYMLFRKMYLWGTIFLALTLLLSVPSYVASFAMVENMFFENGILTSGSALSAEMITRMEMLSEIFYFVRMALNIFIALYVNKMYYNHAREKIEKVRSETAVDGDEYAKALSRKGRTDGRVIVIAGVLVFALYIITMVTFSGKIVLPEM